MKSAIAHIELLRHSNQMFTVSARVRLLNLLMGGNVPIWLLYACIVCSVWVRNIVRVHTHIVRSLLNLLLCWTFSSFRSGNLPLASHTGSLSNDSCNHHRDQFLLVVNSYPLIILNLMERNELFVVFFHSSFSFVYSFVCSFIRLFMRMGLIESNRTVGAKTTEKKHFFCKVNVSLFSSIDLKFIVSKSCLYLCTSFAKQKKAAELFANRAGNETANAAFIQNAKSLRKILHLTYGRSKCYKPWWRRASERQRESEQAM